MKCRNQWANSTRDMKRCHNIRRSAPVTHVTCFSFSSVSRECVFLQKVYSFVLHWRILTSRHAALVRSDWACAAACSLFWRKLLYCDFDQTFASQLQLQHGLLKWRGWTVRCGGGPVLLWQWTSLIFAQTSECFKAYGGWFALSISPH